MVRSVLADKRAGQGETPGSNVDRSVLIQGLELSYGDRPVFEHLDCELPGGAISIVIGASGCGKSTLLRSIGGLVRPRAGSLRVAGIETAGISERSFEAIRSYLGMMFQNGALLNSMTLFDNLALPLRECVWLRPAEIRETVQAQLEAVGLGDAAALLPWQISGGMMKRAALARAMITRPEILLCDEPFSGLDPLTVRKIEQLLMSLNRDHGMTLILTSHHVPSTLRMADRVVFLIDRKAETGSPGELVRHSDPRIASFWDEDAPLEDVVGVESGGDEV